MYGLTSDGFLKRLLKGIRPGSEKGTGADVVLQEPEYPWEEARQDETVDDLTGDSRESHDANRTHGMNRPNEPLPELSDDVERNGGK